MSSAVARPMRNSSKKLTSSTWSIPRISLLVGFRAGGGVPWARSGAQAGGRCPSDLFDAADALVRAPGQVDAEFLRGPEDLVVGLAHLQGHAVAGQHLDVEAQRLQLLEQHLERLRDSRLRDVLALDDGLVDLHAAENVIGLDGEQFLQRVRRAVGLHRPALHLTEPLATELRLTTQRLLRDHRVRAGRPSVNLVVDQVVQLEDVHVADRDRVRQWLTGTTVEQLRLAVAVDQATTVAVDQRRLEEALDLLLARSVEDGGRDVRVLRGLVRLDRAQLLLPLGVVALDLPAGLGDPPEVGLQNLANVHPARHAERVEHDVDRGAVLQERHVLDRQDLRDDALVAVAAGELVTVLDLALLSHVHPDQLVDARRQFVAVLTRERADADDRAGLAVRNLQRGVPDLPGLLPEDGAQQALLGSQLGLALGRDLADQDVAGHDLRADPDDAALVQVGEHFLADVGDVAGDLLRAELGVAGVHLVLLDVDRGEHILLYEALRQDDRVLVVVTLPAHEGHEQVAAEGHLPVVGARSVGDDLAGLDPVTLEHDRLLVDARAGVAAAELVQQVRTPVAVVLVHRHVVGAQVLDHAADLGDDHVTGVDRGAVLHARADQRRLRLDQRHRLALHVRAHQGAVGVVVLEERDHRGRDRGHLTRRDVHVVDVLGSEVVDLTALGADQDPLLGEAALRVERAVGLRDDEAVLLVGGQVVDLVGDLAVLDLAVRRLDEPEGVHPAEGGQRADQADVRALRGLDRAHPAVVARVHVADLHARALTGQTARAQRRQATLVGQTRERVGLVHELRELAGAEELLDGGDDRPDVDQGLRRDRLDVLGRHPLADHALHAGEADPDLVLDQLAHGAQPAVAEVVDVVDAVVGLAGVQTHDVLDGGDDVVLGQRRGALRHVHAELLVHLVAADLGEVVALGVEEEVLQQRLRGLTRRRLARAQLAVDVQQRLVLAGDVVLLQGGQHRGRPLEVLADAVLGPAEGLEQDADRLAALAVDPDADGVALVDVELQPRTATGDDLGAVDVLVRRLVQGLVEVDARAADQLGDDDALGPVDDERALVRHDREVAHEHRLALDLAGGVVHELGRDEQRRRVGHVLVLALREGRLAVLKAGVGKGQGHRAAEVLDRGDLLEDLGEPADGVGLLLGREGGPPLGAADQPVERRRLQGEQVRDLERLLDLREGDAQWGAGDLLLVGLSGAGAARNVLFGGAGGRAGGARACQDASFQGPHDVRAGLCGVVVGNGGAVHLTVRARTDGRPRVSGTCSRAPLVTRLGGQAVRGQRNRRPYPCSDAMSTPGGRVRPAPHPGTGGATSMGSSGRARP